MKRIIVLVFSLMSLLVQAENLDPIKWSFTLSSKEIHVGDTVEIIASAVIIPDWYLYSNDFDPNLGPTITEFKFTADNGYRLLGTPKAIKPKKKFDPIWDGEITYFVGHGEFRQKVIIVNSNPKIEFSVRYQVCTEGSCIPGSEDFTFSALTILPAKKIVKTSVETQPETTLTQETKTNTQQCASIETLEAEKKKLIQRDSKGNDVSVDYLKGFVKKYSK